MCCIYALKKRWTCIDDIWLPVIVIVWPPYMEVADKSMTCCSVQSVVVLQYHHTSCPSLENE